MKNTPASRLGGNANYSRDEDAPCPQPRENDILIRSGTNTSISDHNSNSIHVLDHNTHIPQQLRPFSVEILELPAALVDSSFSYCRSQNSISELRAKGITGISVLLPDVAPSTTEIENVAIAFWVPLSLNEPALFTALLFSSLFSRRGVSLLHGTAAQKFTEIDQRWLEISYLKAVECIGRGLQSETRSADDAIILSTLLMAGFSYAVFDQPLRDWSRKSPFLPPLQSLQSIDVLEFLLPNPLHLAGLMSLVRRKGGIKMIRLAGLGVTIS